MRTAADNKQIILDFFHLSETGGDVLPMLADDLTWWVPGDWALGGTYRKDELGPIFERVFALLDGRPQFTIHNVTAEDDRVAVDASSKGRFKDGGPFGNTYHFFFRLRDGLIVEAKEYLDTAYMVRLLEERPEMAG